MEAHGAAAALDSGTGAPAGRSMGYYIGRLEAFHAVLDIAAPGQPTFGDLHLTPDDPLVEWEAALQAVYRRLGSAVSKLTLVQRENLRDAILEISRRESAGTDTGVRHDPAYLRAVQATYRQIIGAIDIRASAESWLV